MSERGFCTKGNKGLATGGELIFSTERHTTSVMSSLSDLQGMLGKPIRIVLTDGRVIDGNLQCMDKDLNFIIGEANEFHGVEDPSNIDTEVTVTRNIGNAMIPGAHVVKILAQV